jgi:hypothetical protein
MDRRTPVVLPRATAAYAMPKHEQIQQSGVPLQFVPVHTPSVKSPPVSVNDEFTDLQL